MKNKKFSTKITICKEIFDITEDGKWERTISRVKSIWAHVEHTFIKGHVPYLRFFIYGGEMLPDKFCVIYDRKLWKVSSRPVLLPSRYMVFTCTPNYEYEVVEDV